jgi:hypothetical protein
MDDLLHVAEYNGGYLMRHQLNDIGFSDAHIRQAMRTGQLKRVRHGTYVPVASWARMTESERHRVVVRSVLAKLGPGVVASHQSAAAMHGLDLYGVDLGLVHVTRTDGRTGRREAGVVYHRGQIVADRDIREVDGWLVTEPARAVFEACSQATIESGMVVASSAMRLGRVTAEELDDADHRFDHWLGTRRARIAIRIADPRLESVGEVRSLHMMWAHHIPHPELQFVVETVDGRVVARTDFAWIWCRHTGEFDGLFKYGRLNTYPAEPGRAVADEKIREDRVRDQLLGMSRWVWADLAPHAQSATAAAIRQGMARSKRLYLRNATVIPLD